MCFPSVISRISLRHFNCYPRVDLNYHFLKCVFLLFTDTTEPPTPSSNRQRRCEWPEANVELLTRVLPKPTPYGFDYSALRSDFGFIYTTQQIKDKVKDLCGFEPCANMCAYLDAYWSVLDWFKGLYLSAST